jgi:hypothetical protein
LLIVEVKVMNCQFKIEWCPGYTIHFSDYGYGKYIEETLRILGLIIDSKEWIKYEHWTPYPPI